MIGRGFWYIPGFGGLSATYGLAWDDSLWRIRWEGIAEGYLVPPVVAPLNREWLVWKDFPNPSPDPYPDQHALLEAEVINNQLVARDTIAMVGISALHYSAAANAARDWVAIWDEGPTRFFQRPHGGKWSEIHSTLDSQNGVAVAPIDDTTAVVVAASAKIRWGTLTPSKWTDRTPLSELSGSLSSFRRDGAGGHWVGWSTGLEFVVIQHFRSDSTWAEPDTLTAAYPSSEYAYYTVGISLSQEDTAKPIAAWLGISKLSGVGLLYVSWPTDIGWEVAEAVPGSFGAGLQQLVLDDNDDLWVAWGSLTGGIYHTHTYVRAECDTPRAGESAGQPRIQWRLTEPAPGSFWSVWRSVAGASPLQAGRIQAGESLAMSFVDTAAPAGEVLHYSIHRECADSRHRWQSAEVEWLPRRARLSLTLTSRNPAAERAVLEVIGAPAGPLEIEWYDLNGRRVATTPSVAGGSGRDVAEQSVSQGSLWRTGVYLARARTGDGRISPAVKLVVVR